MSDGRASSIRAPRSVPQRVLVLGSSGMVGRSWVELLTARGIPFDQRRRPEFDLMDPESIRRAMSGEHELVINAAAWTDVDGAESNPSGAERANDQAVAQIGYLCKEQGAVLISYSTDYVFAGDARSPYPIDAPIDPINAYGRSKAQGETSIAESGAESILIRTSWVYAPWGTNFVRTIRNLAQNRETLSVVSDQRGRPTSAQHLARASLELYLHGARGIWHLTDEGECSWFDLASEIVEYSEYECRVSPCGSDAFPRPAKRPAYSTLDIKESLRLLGPLGGWKAHLHQVLGSVE